MKEKRPKSKRDCPAERLGILYVSSFFMIALLSGIGQFFILKELSWQSSVASSILELVGENSLDRPLTVASLEIMAEQDFAKRRILVDSFKTTLDRRLKFESSVEAADTETNELARHDPVAADLVMDAEGHRRRAAAAAEKLATSFTAEGSASLPSDDLRGLVQKIRDEETAAALAVSNLMEQAGFRSIHEVARLKRFGYNQFVLVLSVLILEGLFVVNPAVRKIRQFMDKMEQSNKELNTYALKLEWSNKELQDFASVASHDLQEPLRKVQAFSDRLKSKISKSMDPQGLDYLDRVQNAAARMQTLINDLLTYSRISTKAQPFVPTDLKKVAAEVVSDLEVRIEQAEGSVLIGDLPEVDADPLQVRQLMQNLIGNALKYKKPTVASVVKISGTRIGQGSAGFGDSDRELCRLVFEDNGIGFEEVYAEKIFTIFQRLHGRAEYEGTGVGLAVCRKIAERHGGTITAEGRPGEGSTFTVTLPIRHAREKAQDEFTA